jgi:2-oxoisovalerate ferredoxin oxidoreductase beta subunit
MSSYAVTLEKAKSFYQIYERKAELQHQTHYCPGCGHGVVHKLIARAIDEMGIQDRTVLISPVGCSVFAYYYFDVGNIQVAHGRAPAVATAVKRSLPESIVLSYQGDGDLAAIGCAEIVHAANRGENITVIFVNNAIYGMTGGQMAPTTLLGTKTTTSPFGRSQWNEGFPMRVSELLASLEAPVYIERVALGNNKQIMNAGRAVRRALENQARGLGFSLVEVLSPCPTIWKMTPVDAQRRVLEEMTKVFPLGVYRDRTKDAQVRPSPPPPPALEDIPALLGLIEDKTPAPSPQPPAPSPGARRPRSERHSAPHCGFWRAGGIAARGAASRSRVEGGTGGFVAAVVRAGDALGNFQLPRAAFGAADRFAAGVGAECAAGAQRAIAAQVHRRGAARRVGAVQRNGGARGLRA